MLDILSWLWDVAVEPILQNLQINAKSPDDEDSGLPHIWWIGVGKLSTAPFHAAGDYSTLNPSRNVFNYVISSYTPTLKALSYARENDFALARTDSAKRLLVVTMPTTPGFKALPDVDQEAAEILSVINESVEAECLEEPCVDDVLDRLQSCQAVHFACHGISDATDPSSSHLVLLRDSHADKLSAHDISTRNTKGAQLAYLSACSTAHNEAVKLVDETIHIASGFQLAGFSHVLATQWSADSKICMKVSTEFYRLLFDVNEPGEGHEKVRLAFHRAVKKIQERYPRQPLRWAPFIHMGA